MKKNLLNLNENDRKTQKSINKKLINLVGTEEENRKIVGVFSFLATKNTLKKSKLLLVIN